MASDLPEYYFRVRENGAAVFRVDAENRQRRIEMDQIAVVNIRNGEIKPQGDRVLSDGDLERIRQHLCALGHRRYSPCGGLSEPDNAVGAVKGYGRPA